MTTQKTQDSSRSGSNEDLTGNARLTRNVFSSWGSHLVFVVAGFVLPRLIDSHIGQFSLGIWDFCWSLVNYLNFAGIGVGTSVNRYVAKYRAAGEVEELRRTISSVAVIQAIIGLSVALASAALFFALPLFFADRLGTHLDVTRWVVALLGASLAVQMALDTYRGVITGCHRWDLHNGINAGSYAITVVGMIVALLYGGELLSMALIYFFGVVLGEIIRVIVAHRVCPELRIRWSYAGWSYGKKAIVFGGKTMLLGLPPYLMTQTISIVIAATLGPAALAVFSRPMGLVRHIEVFVNKFAFILTPMAGSLQGTSRTEELRELATEGARWGVAFTLPPVLLLAILGDSLITVWMGAAYVHPTLLPILAIGMFPGIGQNSVLRVLMGMNLHGRVGLVCLIIAVVILGIGITALNVLGWSLTGAAVLMMLSLAIPYGVVMPVYACRQLGIPVGTYISRVFSVPVLCGAIFALPLAASRYLFSENALITLIAGSLSGGILLTAMYWSWLFSEEVRSNVRRTVFPSRAGNPG